MSEEIVGGVHAVTAALKSKRPVDRVLIRSGRRDGRSQAIRELADSLDMPVFEVSAEELDRRLPGVNHQGVAALVSAAQVLDEGALDDILEQQATPLFLALDQVQDPHNLGACLRTAAAVGCDAVILPKDRSASLTPAVRKVAAGGAETVPVVQVTNLARCLKRLQKAGCWVAGTDGEATQNIHETDLTVPLVLVMGGEADGLRRLTRESCDMLVGIPMTDAVQSLNVSVAAGVCLFEARRQRSA